MRTVSVPGCVLSYLCLLKSEKYRNKNTWPWTVRVLPSGLFWKPIHLLLPPSLLGKQTDSQPLSNLTPSVTTVSLSLAQKGFLGTPFTPQHTISLPSPGLQCSLDKNVRSHFGPLCSQKELLRNQAPEPGLRESRVPGMVSFSQSFPRSLRVSCAPLGCTASK